MTDIMGVLLYSFIAVCLFAELVSAVGLLITLLARLAGWRP